MIGQEENHKQNHHEQEENAEMIGRHREAPHLEEEYYILQQTPTARMVESPKDSLKEAFGTPQPMPIGCMDERLYRNGCPIDRIANPGSGVLYTPEQLEAFLQNLKRYGIQATTVTRHGSCGAEELSKLSEKDISAKESVLAGKLEVPTSMAPMMDVHGHVARGAILTFSPNLIVSRIRDGLRPFVISGWASPTALEDAKLAVQIAFGSHGYGPDKFGGKNLPFYLTVIGREDAPELRWEAQADLLRPVLAETGIDLSKVVINGFDV